MRGLYIHIPHCHQKCHYCDFVISTNHSEENRKRFFESLELEAGNAAATYGELKFDTLYLGGGTPSLLNPDGIGRVLTDLRKKFLIKENAEVSCEVNPEDVSEEKARVWKELGINRISLGAQTFQDSILKDLGRIHNSAKIAEAVGILQSSGFTNISIDLICKLPNQTVANFEDSIRRAIELEIQQVTIYDLDVHEKTVFGFRRRKGELALPPEEKHIEMIELAESLLEEAGLRRYELSNFAVPGFESKHNLIYWHNGEYLGLGPGAFSYLNGVRFQFAKDVSGYIRKCQARNFRNDEEDLIDDKNREIETILTGIRLPEGVQLAHFPAIRAQIRGNLASLLKEGLIIEKNGRIYLSKRGRWVYEDLIGRLIEF